MFIAVALTTIMALTVVGADASGSAVLADFTGASTPEWVQFNGTAALGRSENASAPGILVHFEQTDWPNVFFRAPDGHWDFSDYGGVSVRLYNPSDAAITVALRLDNEGADGYSFCNTLRASAQPGRHLDFTMLFQRDGQRALWGMRGVPGATQYGEGKPLDLRRIVAFQLFLPKPNQAHNLILERAYLLPRDAAPTRELSMPFVDAFGQYKHEDWPGKLKDVSEFAGRLARESAAWDAAPTVDGRDAYGGWADGPRLEATGWFRTEEVDGKWWLVTPEGTLFLSLGVNCVGTWERTFVEGRSDWFEWLPDEADPLFGPLYSKLSGAHSMAEAIGGGGRAFSFYASNLARKHGEHWKDRWRDSVHRRLQHWGFNTIGNWSQEDVLLHSDMPYVVSASLHGVRLLEGARGYWSKMMDVYDPSFEEKAESAAAHVAARHGGNPLCIGYFFDNELAWEGVVEGVLACGAEQPARQALIAQLVERFGDLNGLNAAWNTDFMDWSALSPSLTGNAAAQEELSRFFYNFSKHYFEGVRDALRRHAANQLYLGCRFAGAPEEAVRACAETVDVVSFNLYYPVIRREQWSGDDSLGKPILIGEFHFGALDRGMFHTGLVAAANQEERASLYAAYVQSVVEHPAFVGCHWFQYIDEPITGRWFDGENYNIGFLDVTDTPYPELVEAAQQAHAAAYQRRRAAQ